MKIIAALLLFLFVGSVYAQNVLEQINHAFAADSSKIIHGEVSMLMKESDTLIINKYGNQFYVPLKEIDAINYVTYNRYSNLILYTKDDKKCIRGAVENRNEFYSFFSMGLYSKYSAQNAMKLFFNLYEELAYSVPNASNVRMLNDKVYEKWTMKSKGISNDGFFIHLAGVDSNFTGHYFIKYPNGNLRCERNLINGVCDGKQLDYFENGQLEDVRIYINGLADGKWMGYNDNGRLVYKTEYNKGIENGLLEVWFEDGTKNIEMYFENGKPVWEKYWDPEGTLVSDINWKEMENK